MTKHLSNAMYGAFDYAAYPIIMLAATPTLLHHLGVGTFGLWLIANAAISTGTLVASGFGDAVIQRVAILRSGGSSNLIGKVVANMLAINLLLSGVLSTLLFLLIPFFTGRITRHDPALEISCLWSLRVGAGLIVLKAIESVFIAVQKAFECYAVAVKLSVLTRLSVVGMSVALALSGYDLPKIMVGTALVTSAGVIAQWNAVRRLGVGKVVPRFDRAICVDLASFGIFSWLQGISGIFFSQADRLLLALTLGASAVSYYGVCVQMAQPIHGLTAAGLHFVFPYLAAQHSSGKMAATRLTILRVLAVNVACATLSCIALSFFGNSILERWMGATFAAQSSAMIPLLALGFGMLSLNITAHYALLAMGQVRLVTAFNIAGGIVMLIAIVLLVPHRGVDGAALARLAYGPVTCLLYIPLFRMLASRGQSTIHRSHVLTEQA
jgi:O-antigen/teichoic acid export membrane protein